MSMGNIMFFQFMKIFQTAMLVFVGYLTLFFDIEDFTDRIMVTLTTMLVVATITSSIQQVSVTASKV